MTTKVQYALEAVERELSSAQDKFPPMVSAHEGWAIIKEELDELWEEIRLDQHEFQDGKKCAEACQVAAMAVRFMADLC